MTLGEKIRELRQKQGLSQEALAAHLGVSRQAVSKWEKNLSYPDTENLLALAALFGVSSDELAGIKQEENTKEPASEEDTKRQEPPEKKHWTPVRIVILVILLVFLFFVAIPMFIYTAFRYETVGPAISTDAISEAEIVENQVFKRPTAEEIGEFALIWDGEGSFEYLSIGKMEEPRFPFGTTLQPTQLEQVYDTDFGVMKLHHVNCGPLQIEYLRITEENAEPVDSLSRISTMIGGYKTPRGIGVGSDESEVIDWYGDELVYVMKETGDDSLCIHEYKYVYSPEGAGGAAMVFYMAGGHVSGITIHAGDDRGSEAYRVDNVYIFPMKDGKPDFRQREEPEREEIDETRAVYIALYALNNDINLSAEERYTHSRTIYQNLQHLDWQAYGLLGEAGKETATQEELLHWLIGQETLSAEAIEGLLSGGCRANLDGWLTDSYAIAMARAFVAYPESYVEILAGDEFSDAEREEIVSLTGYGCDTPEDFHEEALAAMESLVGDPLRLGEEEWIWGEMLRERIRNGV